jgi:hypothetical protein
MPPTLAQPYTKPRVLIGEGRDEVNFFEALVDELKLTDIQVEEYGGKPNLAAYLQSFRLRPGHQAVASLGITRDSDANPASVFQSACTLLAQNGLPVPGAAGQGIAGTPRIGVFLLPDNRRPGMLEDLCLDAVQADGAMPCVTDFFLCVGQSAQRQPNNPAKARVHAWLASQVDPDLRLGEAARKGYWPWTSSAFGALKQFLVNL